MATVGTCDVCGTPIVFSVQNQRENVQLEANEREGVAVCASCHSGFYIKITRTRESDLDKPELSRKRVKNT